MNLRQAIRTGGVVCLCFTAAAWATINTGGQTGVVRTLSGKAMGKTKMNVGAGVNFAQSADYVKGPKWDLSRVESKDPAITNVIQDPAKVISSDFFLGLGLFNFWDLCAALPLYYDWSGFGPSNPTDAGLGDLEISTKFMMPPITFDKYFYSAVFLSVTLPTGMKGNGLFPRHPHLLMDQDSITHGYLYSVGDYVTVKPMMLFTFDFIKKVPLQAHVNLGVVFTEVNKQNTLVGGLALEYTPKEFITLFAEIWGESRWSNLSSSNDMRKDPLWATPGVRITAPNGLYFYLAGDFSLSSKRDQDRYNWDKKNFRYSTGIQPDYGVHFSFGWSGFLVVQDRDKDGIKDDMDKCPDDAEDIDGFEDSDGCPDPDNDKDGMCDPWVAEKHLESKYAAVCKGIDKCPTKPEDIDGFKDDDGCPDPDNDRDGILDVKDQCPGEAEDFDGFQDNDGCPDFDNDKDGVPDSVDKCTNEPEDNDGFEDKDGCADIDNDKDGIPDPKDKCPDRPESYNGHMDEDGCPDTVAAPSRKETDFPREQTLRGVTFRPNTAELMFESYQWLDPIVKAMKEYPELEIEVRGYFDSIGKYSSAMQLTQRRAEAVRQYLISQGVEIQRVRAVGYGPANPIADNRTASGRALNRRIEIVRIK